MKKTTEPTVKAIDGMVEYVSFARSQLIPIGHDEKRGVVPRAEEVPVRRACRPSTSIVKD